MDSIGIRQMKSTKGAMELSVTAIVVLILAIVMLGLGLGFIRGMFSKVSTSFDEQISTEPEAALANARDPITLSRESIITEAGASLVLKVSVYNTGGTATGTIPDITCSDGLIDPEETANNRAVASGEIGTFTMLMGIKSGATAGVNLCSVSLEGMGPKDFTIEVR